MKNRFQSLPSLLALAIVTAFPGSADGTESPPLGRYATLWSASALTEQLEPSQAKPVEDPAAKPPERQPAPGKIRRRLPSPEALSREIEELKKRVATLEEALGAGRKEHGGSTDQTGEVESRQESAVSEWLRRHEPKPTTDLRAATDLEKLTNREALRNGLRVKRRKLLQTARGQHFDRARIEIEVSGPEKALYRWLDRLQSPTDFRAVTYFRINPMRNDDTQVDCLIIVEQWFIPEGAGKSGGAAKSDRELLPLIEGSHYPIELMFQLSNALPDEGIRFKRVEIANQLTADGLVRHLLVHGVAEELEPVNTFSANLKKTKGFHDYVWMMPNPTSSKGAWNFLYQAEFSPTR